MNLNRTLLSAVLLGGVLTTSALATPAAAHAKVAEAVRIEAPVVTKVVSPTGLSRRLGSTVTLSLQVDAQGCPSDVKVLSHVDRAATGNLVAAVSQWRFTPAKKNGVAVPSRITLPVTLVEASS